VWSVLSLGLAANCTPGTHSLISPGSSIRYDESEADMTMQGFVITKTQVAGAYNVD